MTVATTAPQGGYEEVALLQGEGGESVATYLPRAKKAACHVGGDVLLIGQAQTKSHVSGNQYGIVTTNTESVLFTVLRKPSSAPEEKPAKQRKKTEPEAMKPYTPPQSNVGGNDGSGLILAGWLTFGLTYGATVAAAAALNGTYAFIPVVGPFLQLSNTPYVGLNVLSGVVQVTGLALAIIGHVKQSSSSYALIPVVTPDSAGMLLTINL